VRVSEHGETLEITNGVETMTVDAETGVPRRMTMTAVADLPPGARPNTAAVTGEDTRAEPPSVAYDVRRVEAADLP
jgi:hypothetical protein